MRKNLIQLNRALLQLEGQVIFTNVYYQLKENMNEEIFHLVADKTAIIFVADIYSRIMSWLYRIFE